jgi:hypothetical protein
MFKVVFIKIYMRVYFIYFCVYSYDMSTPKSFAGRV